MVNISYRPSPQTTFSGTLRDVSAAYSWVCANIAQYGGDISRVFVSGDSAGGTLALYSTVVENSADLAQAIGVPQAGLKPAGMVLVCGRYDLTKHFSPEWAGSETYTYDDYRQYISSQYMKPVAADFGLKYSSLEGLLNNVSFPQAFINSATDDFLVVNNLDLARELALRNMPFEIDIARADVQTEGKLGHVYVIGKAGLQRSQHTLDLMSDFMRQ